MAATAKGAVVKAGHDYLRATYGERVWEKVLGRLTPEQRSMAERAGSLAQVPVSVDGAVFAAFVAVQFGGDRALAEHELRRGGAAQADAMLDGLFSVFARFVSPQQAFSRGGSVITSVYTGVGHETTESPSGRGGSIKLTGLGQSAFIAPWQCGWIQRALERFGATDPHVTERSWADGQNASDELVYDIAWS
jgi:hypothetical protein